MRNERRNRNNTEGLDLKKILYISGSILALAVIAFVITFIAYGNKMEEETKLGSLNTNMVEDYANTTSTEQASSDFGKTVNEMEEETSNELTNEITNETTNETKNEMADETSTNTTDKQENVEKYAINTSRAEEEAKSNNTKEQKSTETKTEDPKFIQPVKGEINREFAKDKLTYSDTLGEWVTHNGIDIKAAKTTVVKAAADGTIKSIKNDPRYGLTVVIEHANNFTTVYSNLLTAEFVVEGEKVKQDQTIATVGNTATFEIADEPHLHFEILKDGKYLDPELYIKK